jgi:hypothetical protein
MKYGHMPSGLPAEWWITKVVVRFEPRQSADRALENRGDDRKKAIGMSVINM